MRLHEVRIDRGLTQPFVVSAMRKVDRRADVPLYSKMENGLCLPTPPMLAAILAVLEADRREVYDDDELFIRPDAPAALPPALPAADDDAAEEIVTTSTKPATPRKPDRHRLKHKVQFRVTDYVAYSLPLMVRALGYKSVQEWLDECYQNLRERYLREHPEHAARA